MTMSASFSHRAIASWHPYFRLQYASFSGRAIYRNRVHWQQTHIVSSTFFYVEQKLRWVICMFLSAANVESDIFFPFFSHEGPVWQIAWAHPMYGSILASCGYDRKVIIWKENGGSWEKLHEYANHDSSGIVTSPTCH